MMIPARMNDECDLVDITGKDGMGLDDLRALSYIIRLHSILQQLIHCLSVPMHNLV